MDELEVEDEEEIACVDNSAFGTGGFGKLLVRIVGIVPDVGDSSE